MFKYLLIMMLCISSITAQAKTVWSDFSVTYLNGGDYEVGDKDREVVTFEYANGTTWGDTFMFFDRLKSSNGDVETYGEFSPRIKIKDYSDSFIKSVFFAPSVEFGPGTNYLVGVGLDLDIKFFDYFQVNTYLRNNDDGDRSEQVTLVWGIPLGPLYYDGFMDYATGVDNTVNGDTKTQMNFTSQLKYNLASILDLDTKLYVGVEYAYWVNKFGIDGVDENNINLLVKYHF
ncbi:MAG: nucleoside-specific outer membrane channel protein Tsx [Colwellia sp.]|mgnify:CR=1 FL=1|jgi:nucleoside-specific outer membrane channel protein Tsx|tara:strand:- start:5803 stop:6495 length:693 start_codon:yes stop_codon:yes gene_type:complete